MGLAPVSSNGVFAPRPDALARPVPREDAADRDPAERDDLAGPEVFAVRLPDEPGEPPLPREEPPRELTMGKRYQRGVLGLGHLPAASTRARCADGCNGPV